MILESKLYDRQVDIGVDIIRINRVIEILNEKLEELKNELAEINEQLK